MIHPHTFLIVPAVGQLDALDAFAELAKSRAHLNRLHALWPAPSLTMRLAAADFVLVRRYGSLVREGLGAEAAAILSLYHASYVRLAADRRAA